jgi:hypothetical protein
MSGASKAYALLVDQYGYKIWDKVSSIPSGYQFGGVNQRLRRSRLGGDGQLCNGNLIFAKINPYGELTLFKEFPISAFGWSIIPSGDGGYIMAGTRWVVKVDDVGNVIWNTLLNLPLSPYPAGSPYTYTEFEEIVALPVGVDGYIVTGSAFSNQTSAAYTVRIGSDGTQQWANIHQPRNTGDPGTPVSWISSAIIDGQLAITSWRSGPVSSGGTMYIQRQYFNGTKIYGETSLGNTIPVQEAFFIKPHGKYVIGGTRGSYYCCLFLYKCILTSDYSKV